MKNELLRAIEQKTGLCMQRNHDFLQFSQMIYEETHNMISPTTLKRVWGYINDQASNPSKGTINLLARFLGFNSYEDFCLSGWGICSADKDAMSAQSEIFMSKVCTTDNLSVGDEVVAQWKPNRCCTFRYLGNDMFEVTNSERAKISVGDTFRCGMFVEGEPLMVCNLTHEGVSGMSYCAGKTDGITFDVRSSNEA